jgi:DNA gyrase subunit A
MVKRSPLSELPGLSAKAFRVMGVADDSLGWAEWTTGAQEILLITAEGKGIRFSEEDVRPMGLPAAGVNGVKLGGKADAVISMLLADVGKHIWVITNTGMAKSSPLEEFPVQGRYGQGVIAAKIPDKTAHLAAAAIGDIDDTLVVVTSKNKPKYMRLSLAPQTGRNSTGSSVIALGAGEHVRGVVMPGVRSIGLTETEES